MTDQELKELELFVKNYNDYTEREFGNDEITPEQAIEENELGVMYTTSAYDEEYGLQDDMIEFQVSYNIKDLALYFYIDGVKVEEEHFNSIFAMAEDVGYSEFDSYYDALNHKLYELIDTDVLVIDGDGLAIWNS